MNDVFTWLLEGTVEKAGAEFIDSFCNTKDRSALKDLSKSWTTSGAKVWENHKTWTKLFEWADAAANGNIFIELLEKCMSEGHNYLLNWAKMTKKIKEDNKEELAEYLEKGIYTTNWSLKKDFEKNYRTYELVNGK
jgi:hypothetical protein